MSDDIKAVLIAVLVYCFALAIGFPALIWICIHTWGWILQ